MPSGRQAKGSDLPGNLLPTKKEINNSSNYLVCLAVQRFGYCWHEGDTERKWQKRRNGGEGNASYSRESDSDCVKINLHEIE